jgi:integrase
MRAGELVALEPGDVDLQHGVVHITRSVDRETRKVKSTKSGTSRRIPIEGELRPLERLYAERARATDEPRPDSCGYPTTRSALCSSGSTCT